MIKYQIISPEITLKKQVSSSFLLRAFRYFIRPINPIIYQLHLKKWGHNSDDRVLDWDWKKINFNRIAVVNLLLKNFESPSYLEIGCASDYLFNSVPVSDKVGVDPSSGGNVRETSDAFFKTNSKKFNLIFIDGLHTYEQVRRDILNSISSLKKGGYIVLHDMLPRSWVEQHIPIISSGAWTGDVWKVAFELIETEGVDFKILKIDHGVGVIRVLKENVKLKDLRVQLKQKQFSYYLDNINKLPIAEWNDAQNWLIK